MDPDRFDGLLRALSASPSRRKVGRVLAGLIFGAALEARLDLGAIEAKKRKGKGKRKKDKNREKPCAPNTWSGCCLNGKRMPGTANDACESNGFPCENCAEQGLVCRQQTCGCNETICALEDGCCLAATECAPGTSEEACGGDGKACQTCDNDQRCDLPHGIEFRTCCGTEGAFCGTTDDGIFGIREYRCCRDHLCHEDVCKANCNFTGCADDKFCCTSLTECLFAAHPSGGTSTNCRRPDGGLTRCPQDAACCLSMSGGAHINCRPAGRCGEFGETEQSPVTCSG